MVHIAGSTGHDSSNLAMDGTKGYPYNSKKFMGDPIHSLLIAGITLYR